MSGTVKVSQRSEAKQRGSQKKKGKRTPLLLCRNNLILLPNPHSIHLLVPTPTHDVTLTLVLLNLGRVHADLSSTGDPGSFRDVGGDGGTFAGSEGAAETGTGFAGSRGGPGTGERHGPDFFVVVVFCCVSSGSGGKERQIHSRRSFDPLVFLLLLYSSRCSNRAGRRPLVSLLRVTPTGPVVFFVAPFGEDREGAFARRTVRVFVPLRRGRGRRRFAVAAASPLVVAVRVGVVRV